MKKGRKITALLMALATVGAMTAGFVACTEPEEPPKEEQTAAAEKLKDGGAVVFTDGSAAIDLSQYVKANGNEFRVASSNPNVVAINLAGHTLTVTEVGSGTAIITVACGEVRITFSVVVGEILYSITLDGVPVPCGDAVKWAAGSTYTLPEAKTPEDPNMEFKGWSVNGERKEAGAEITVNKNLTVTAIVERKAATEVNGHAQFVSLNAGGTATVAVADYIAAYGREVSAALDGNDYATLTQEGGVVTLSGVAQGTARLTLSTEGVTVQIEVRVLSANMPTFENAVLNIDIFTQNANSLTFAPNEPSNEHEYAYVYSLQTQDAKASISGGALTYTAGYDYEIEDEEEGDSVALVIDAAVTIDGAPAGTVSFTVTVRITDSAPAAPTFDDIIETINPFNNGSCTLKLLPPDDDFTYAYSIGGTPLTADKTYTTEAEEEVTVTYTYKANPNRSGTATFKVKVSYDKSVFPALKEESKEVSVDLAEAGGEYSVELFSNFSNVGNIESYTVNGTPHTTNQVYSITNAGGTYDETATDVTYTVEAIFKNGFGTLSYTYTVHVTDTTAFRMANGNFEEESNGKPTGWTGATGELSSAGIYWDKYEANNDGQYYAGTEANTETLTSPTFKVGGSGWITFKYGSSRPIDADGTTLRNMHLEFYEKGNGSDTLIADVRNVLFKDPEAALRLNDYKIDLSSFMGKTVYVKAVAGETNKDFRAIYLDSFVTYYKEAPTDSKYTDLTSARYFNPTAEIDLKDKNTVTINPYLSQGLIADCTLTATVDKAGLTVDSGNPFLLTAAKSGTYKVTYKQGEETVFTATVTVTNTAELPTFDDLQLSVKKDESGTINLPLPASGSRFTYAYAVNAAGASIAENVFTYVAGGVEGTYQVEVTVTMTDTKWDDGGDTFTKKFTVSVTVYGEKIVAGDLLKDGEAALAFDAYALKQENAQATSVSIDFSKYLIIPEGLNVTYAVTRAIGDGTATDIAAEGGKYSLPFADCNLTANKITTVVFEVTATNGDDSTNTVSFTITVSMKDTTQNRVINGGFETGDMTGWTALTDGFNSETCVISAENYWGEKLPYNQSGNYHLDGWHTGIAEEFTWGVKSTEFTLGGSGWISVKMGGRTAAVKVFKADGTQIGLYRATHYKNVAFPDVSQGSWADMRTYVIDLSDYKGEVLYLELWDIEEGEDWGNGFFDEVITYYETAPDWEHEADTVENGNNLGTVQLPWKKGENTYVTPTED